MRLSNAAAVTGVEFFFAWDVAGDKIAIGPTDAVITPHSGLTTTSIRGLSAALGGQILDWNNEDAIEGILYLFLKLTGGTADIQQSRLFWDWARS